MGIFDTAVDRKVSDISNWSGQFRFFCWEVVENTSFVCKDMSTTRWLTDTYFGSPVNAAVHGPLEFDILYVRSSPALSLRLGYTIVTTKQRLVSCGYSVLKKSRIVKYF